MKILFTIILFSHITKIFAQHSYKHKYINPNQITHSQIDFIQIYREKKKELKNKTN